MTRGGYDLNVTEVNLSCLKCQIHWTRFTYSLFLKPVSAQLGSEHLSDPNQWRSCLIPVAQVLTRDPTKFLDVLMVFRTARAIEQHISLVSHEKVGMRGQIRKRMLRICLP